MIITSQILSFLIGFIDSYVHTVPDKFFAPFTSCSSTVWTYLNNKQMLHFDLKDHLLV